MPKGRIRHIPFGVIAIICYIFTVIIGWSYGNSFPVYVSITILLAILVYYRFFTKRIPLNTNLLLIIKAILCVTFVASIINGDMQSCVMVNVSLIFPLAFCTMDIDYRHFERQLIVISLVNLVIVDFLLTQSEIWNSNSLAFMIFSGISVGMLWFKFATTAVSKMGCIVYFGYVTPLLLLTGCRNAGLVILVCFVLLLLPIRLYKSALIFRILYISSMLLTVIAADFMEMVLSDDRLMDELLSYTSSFSKKAWSMDTHYILLEAVTSKFRSYDILTQLFGMGVKTYHAHNLFYQCMFFYGYVGTLFIYIFYIYVFERAYRLIKYNDDTVALGCAIILVGHFLLQIGEVYMLGAETCTLMALLPAVIILHRWIKTKNANKLKNENTDNISLLQA